MIRNIRLVLTVVVFVTGTAALAPLLFVTSFIQGVATIAWRRTGYHFSWSPVWAVVKLWVWLAYLQDLILGQRCKIEIQGDIQLRRDDRVLVIAPHPPDGEYQHLDRAVTKVVRWFSIRPIIKTELWMNPMGWLFWGMGGLRIDRDGGECTKQKMRRWASRLPPASCLIFFPDGTRRKKERRVSKWNKLRQKMSDLAALLQLHHICSATVPPNPGGITEYVETLPALRIILVQQVNDTGIEWVGDYRHRPAGTVHIRVREVELSSDSEERYTQVMALWEDTATFMQQHLPDDRVGGLPE